MKIEIVEEAEAGVVLIKLTGFASANQLQQVVHTLNERMDRMGSSEQQDIDQVTAALQQQGQALAQVKSDTDAAQAQLQSELNDLEAQIQSGQAPDLSGLQAAVQANGDAIAPLDSAVQALGSLVPQTPPPPPAAPPAGAPGA